VTQELLQPEPVAWLCENAAGHKYFRWKKPMSEYKPKPLYAHPPAQPAPTGKAPCARHCEATAFQIEIRRLNGLLAAQPAPVPVPLTDEQIDAMWREPMSADWEHREFARAIEAHHGIVASPEKKP
jgi:hypothetical protein